MKQRVDRLESKLDQILEKQAEHNATLKSQHESWKLHMARTEALEKIVLPIKRKVDMAEGAFKLIGAISTAVGMIVGAIKIFEFLMK